MNSRYFEGFMVGGLLGFVFGMLTAPKSGAELRREIATTSEDLYKTANEQMVNLKDRTDMAIQDFSAKHQDLISNVETAKATVSNRVQQLASTGRELKEKLTDAACTLTEEAKELKDKLTADTIAFKDQVAEDTRPMRETLQETADDVKSTAYPSQPGQQSQSTGYNSGYNSNYGS